MDPKWKLFVEIWENSNSVQEVAVALNKSKNATNKDAMKLRKLGVPLKSMRESVGHGTIREAPNVAELTTLIEEIRAQKAS